MGSGELLFARSPVDAPVELDGKGMLRAETGPAVIELSVESQLGDRIQSDIAISRLPSLRVFLGGTGSCLLVRSEGHLAADGNDDFFLVVNSTGREEVRAAGHIVELGAGHAALLSAADRFSIERVGQGAGMALRVPRASILALAPRADDHLARGIGPDSPQLRLLTAYVRSLAEQQIPAGPELRHAIASHIHDLIALTVGAGGDRASAARDRGLAAARLQAIKDDVIANLALPSLSATEVAQRHRMTPRHLHRLFESEGVTFSSFVLGRRLARAQRMLTDPRLLARNIATIVFDAGFSDVSYFNRMFRRRFGTTPSDVRQAALRRAHGAQPLGAAAIKLAD